MTFEQSHCILIDLVYEIGVIDEDVPRPEVMETISECGVTGPRMFRYQFYAWMAACFGDRDDDEFEAITDELIASYSTNHY